MTNNNNNSPLLSFLPEHVIENLLENLTKSKDTLAWNWEQRFGAVVLFADISGFTKLSEMLGSYGKAGTEELTNLLNTFFGEMIEIVQTYGGNIAKFGGDALTILFRYDQAAKRALLCAFAMQEHAHNYHNTATLAGKLSLGMKAGLAHGSVFCTTVGDPQIRLEYIVAGTPLNLCAEAEHHAKRGEVIIHTALLPHVNDLVEETASIDANFIQINKLKSSLATTSSSYQVKANHPEHYQELEELLIAYIHPAVAKRLVSSDFVNEHRKITVLFARFDDFDYDHDEQIQAKLQAYLGEIIRLTNYYDSYLMKIDMGDKGSKIIILFGAPITHENDTERALRCALDIRQASLAHNVNISMGINSGLVYCGQIGSDRRREYSAVGDAINIAARLMQAASPNQILVSEASYEYGEEETRQAFDWTNLAPIEVKGKTQPIKLLNLIGLKQAKPAALYLQEQYFASPLIGREAEQQLVNQKLELVLQQKGQIIGIKADAGLGKSRLVAQIVKLAAQKQIIGYGSGCQSYSVNSSYLVWQDIWRAFFGINANTSLEEQLSTLETQLNLLNPAFMARLPLLAEILKLPLPNNELTVAIEDAKLRKEYLENFLVDCLRQRVAGKTALLLVLEDCHWIDPLSKDLLEVICRNVTYLPVMVVMAYRPPETTESSWQSQLFDNLPHSTEIALTELNNAESNQLISLKLKGLFGDHSLNDTLLTRVSEQAGGNPFYLEELVNLIHDLDIEPSNIMAIEQLELPDNVQSLLLSRIDRLSEEEKTVLKVASVVGRIFKPDWIWQVYPAAGSATQVNACLEKLQRLDITRLTHASSEPEYIFKHILTQEVTYQSISLVTRAMLHEAIAAHIESQSADIDLLAYHYERSRNKAKQREYFRKAGEAAQSVYGCNAAINYYQKLLPLLEEEIYKLERIETKLKLGQVLEIVGQWDAASQHYQQSLELATALDNPALLARAQNALGGCLFNQGKYDEALNWLEQAKNTFEAANDLLGLSQSLNVIGNVYWGKGDYNAAQNFYTTSLALYRNANDKANIAKICNNLGITAYYQGNYSLEYELYEESLIIYNELNDKLGIARVLNNLADAERRQGNNKQAQEFFQQSLVISQQFSTKLEIVTTLNGLGLVAFEETQYGEAQKFFQEALKLEEELDDKWGMSGSLFDLSQISLHYKDYTQAKKLLENALHLKQELDNKFGIAQCLAGLVRIAEASGQLELGIQVYSRAEILFEESGSFLEPLYNNGYQQAIESLKQKANQTTFEANWQAGRLTVLEDFIEKIALKIG